MSDGPYSRWRRFLEPTSNQVDSYVVVQIPQIDQGVAGLLKIADCTRVIELWFPWGTEMHITRTRNKIAVLREALDRLEKNMNRLYDHDNPQ